MIYLVAKSRNKHGCYAWRTTSGQHIVKIKRSLHINAKTKNVQIVTISRPSAYGEYAPYTFVHSEQEFLEKANSLAD
jgi:hypothetical protein